MEHSLAVRILNMLGLWQSAQEPVHVVLDTVGRPSSAQIVVKSATKVSIIRMWFEKQIEEKGTDSKGMPGLQNQTWV